MSLTTKKRFIYHEAIKGYCVLLKVLNGAPKQSEQGVSNETLRHDRNA
jgi:hypothetical protein